MNLASIGGFMAAAGLLSSVLTLVNMNLRLLMWIDMWGSTVGWAIRVGLIVVGGGLFLLGQRGEAESGEAEGEDVPGGGTPGA
ncbi:MAG: hypothetical protein AAF447_19275 [Myxococcota bacterium]